jgi:hypothetical protein
MIFVWGKRTYGSVHRVGNISVKTVFGHLWYLPLFPVRSYYVEHKTKAAYELNGLNWRSVLFGYLRVWLPIAIVASLAILSDPMEPQRTMIGWTLAAIAVAALIGTYLYDKKSRAQDIVKVRELMQSHFGVALDPFECLTSLQQEIDQKSQAASIDTMDQAWYKAALKDAFSTRQTLELALLRARCDQHDQPLQQLVLEKLKRAA